MKKDLQERMYHHTVPIDQITEDAALSRISNQLNNGDLPKQIITLNNETYSQARRYPSFRRVLDESWMVLNESYGLTSFSWIDRPRLSKIPGGVYLAEKIVKICADEQKQVVLVGSKEENRIKAKKLLQEKHFGLQISVLPGDYSYTAEDTNYIVQGLRELNPNFVLLAGDEIKSQLWIHRNIILPGVILCLIGNFGGTIDYLVGSPNHWRPKEKDNRWGISTILINAKRTPERRRRAIRGMANMAVLAVEDLLNHGK